MMQNSTLKLHELLPKVKRSVNSINHIFSSISVLLCIPFLIPRLTLDLIHFHTAGLEGWWDPAYRHMCGTHTVKQMAVKSLVMSVWTICVAA